MSALRRRSTWLALVALLAAGTAAWFWTRGDASTDDPRARARRAGRVAVEATPVQRTTLLDLRQFSGTLQSGARFAVAPKIAGRLARLPVDIGDSIVNGQVVARLDDDEAVQQVDQARAELGVANAALAEARSLLSIKQRQYQRIRQLHQRGIASESELESAQVEATAAEARVEVARAQLTQREAALRGAQVRLSYTVIRASWSGDGGPRRVGERLADEGDLLAANQTILTIVDLGTLTAVVNATERDYPRLAVGQPARVRADAFGERAFAGHIARLAPVFRESSRQARVEVAVVNEGQLLKPGMFAGVTVEVGRAEDVTAVPVEALVNRDGRSGVFLVTAGETAQGGGGGRAGAPSGGNPGSARFVPVETGIVHRGLVQVLSPALSGAVVTLGNHLLSDGVAISVVDSPPPHAATATGEPRGDGQGGPSQGAPAEGAPGANPGGSKEKSRGAGGAGSDGRRAAS